MRKLAIITIIFALTLSSNAFAQRKSRPKKKAEPVIVEDPKFTEMLGYTAKVIIIDSIVVDSTKFLDAIYANPEEGQLFRYDNFFSDSGEGVVYLNELGDKCIYPKAEEGSKYKQLYESDLLSDGWTKGKQLEGIDEDGQLYDFDHPYLMPDGITLYFSARSSEGLGGYDIYRTRFDQDEGKFLRPENIGLPFNSDADDFMYVIDEENRLAYFATNRRQPAGKVCVYTFIPFETRKTVSGDDAKIRSLAKLERIADTWENGTEHKQALARKQNALALAANQRLSVVPSRLEFIVNDHTVYHNLSDFRVAANKDRMKKLLAIQKQARDLANALLKARNYYATASSIERGQLSYEILQSEQQIEELNAQMSQLEKTIRNTENQ